MWQAYQFATKTPSDLDTLLLVANNMLFKPQCLLVRTVFITFNPLGNPTTILE